MPGYQDVLALPRALAPLQPSLGGGLFCCVQTDYTPKRNIAEAVGLGSHIATLHGHLLKPVFALSVSSGNEDASTQKAKRTVGSRGSVAECSQRSVYSFIKPSSST